MYKTFGGMLLLCSMAASPALATVFLIAPLVPIDTVNWSQLGADGTALPTNFSANSGLGITVFGNFTVTDGLVSTVCDPVTPLNCSWTPPTLGYSAGETLIWAEDTNFFGSGPITLSFAAQSGIGAYIQTTSPGQFSGSLQVFNGAILLGSQAFTSDITGNPLFMGAVSSFPEITSAAFGVTACGSFACDPNDFSINTLQIYAASSTPEPATFALAGAALAIGFGLRKRALNASKTTLTTTIVALILPLWAQEPILDPSQLKLLSTSPAQLHLGRSPVVNSFIGTPKLQIWQYQMVSPRDGNIYAGSIVGGNPFNRGARTTTIPIVIIPLRVEYTGVVRTFDPTSPDDGCLGAGNTALSLTQQSTIFQPANHVMNGISMGNTTFPDAFQRASFWPSVSTVSPAYHLGLSVSVAAKQTISIVSNTTDGATYNFGGNCSTNPTTVDNPARMGLVDINYLDPLLKGIITNLGITPNQFPLFVLYGVVISNGAANTTNNCCILGYHNGSGIPANPGQTYGIAEYDQGYLFQGTKNISVLSHEFLEWVNDPSVANLVPDWGGLGQVGGCQNNIETGDPLSGSLMPGITMSNGVTYFAQEQAFFSWFMGGPTPGAGGKYSSNGTFGGFAKACPNGGTN